MATIEMTAIVMRYELTGPRVRRANQRRSYIEETVKRTGIVNFLDGLNKAILNTT